MPAGGGNKRRRQKNANKHRVATTDVRYADPDKYELYCLIKKNCGGTELRGITREFGEISLRISGAMRKRKYANPGSFVLVEKRNNDASAGEIIEVYNAGQTSKLRAQGLLDFVDKGSINMRQSDISHIGFEDTSAPIKVQKASTYEDIYDMSMSDDSDIDVDELTTGFAQDELGNFIDEEGEAVDVDELVEKKRKERTEKPRKAKLVEDASDNSEEFDIDDM